MSSVLKTGKSISRNEILMAASIAMAAFFIIFGYELLRSASSTLFNQAYGVQNLPIVLSFLPVALIVILFFYNQILSATGPKNTLLITTFACGVIMLLCYFFILREIRWASGLLYIFRECYVMLIIEQFWSFLNSRLNRETAKKLSGPVIGISSIGGVLGGLTLSQFVVHLGTLQMVPLAAALILPTMAFSILAYKKGGEPKRDQRDEQVDESGSHFMGFKLLAREKALLVMFFVILSTQVLSNLLLIQFQTFLQTAYPEPDAQTAVSGNYYAALNAASGILQFLAVPLILKFVPYRMIHRGIPLVHLLTCLYMFFAPSLFSAGLSFFIFKALDYSIFKAAKEIFYIPFSFDVRYRAKQVIDTFGYRFGKGGSSLVLSFIQTSLLSPATYAFSGFCAALIWFALVVPKTLFRKM